MQPSFGYSAYPQAFWRGRQARFHLYGRDNWGRGQKAAPIRKFIRASLGNEGYRLIEAVSAGEGLTSAGRQLPDLVMLDLGLPDQVIVAWRPHLDAFLTRGRPILTPF
jgi:hypothetical protein